MYLDWLHVIVQFLAVVKWIDGELDFPLLPFDGNLAQFSLKISQEIQGSDNLTTCKACNYFIWLDTLVN